MVLFCNYFATNFAIDETFLFYAFFHSYSNVPGGKHDIRLINNNINTFLPQQQVQK